MVCLSWIVLRSRGAGCGYVGPVSQPLFFLFCFWGWFLEEREFPAFFECFSLCIHQVFVVHEFGHLFLQLMFSFCVGFLGCFEQPPCTRVRMEGQHFVSHHHPTFLPPSLTFFRGHIFLLPSFILSLFPFHQRLLRHPLSLLRASASPTVNSIRVNSPFVPVEAPPPPFPRHTPLHGEAGRGRARREGCGTVPPGSLPSASLWLEMGCAWGWGCVCTRHRDTADVGACDDNTSACARIYRRCSRRPFAPRDTEQVRGKGRTRGHATRNGRRRRREGRMERRWAGGAPSTEETWTDP